MGMIAAFGIGMVAGACVAVIAVVLMTDWRDRR